ncbi:oxidoreductase, short chain dehydrogenase/reductase family protein [Aeromicrobium marinum DSM 15272]|uniref:Oxidoreductase, short chain dehydrogenase/reductase family protein n=1 Tax=Aeromicrobium marinum DSM 15272 TaxID=585531 RepID=E2SEN5_9ACTN|nr:SDR family oxidoreductase [Aeromicrobium marinum]EFQ82332.1 oxidoreductase, short chain dehydrogenase/reductase family protein [Aeromicrobium marinum DSM 15272]
MILHDEVVVISGVGAGLGAKLAARAAAEGAKVVLAARSGMVTDQAVAEITAAGGEAVAVACDVRKPEDVERVAATAVERYGKITGLVNSAYSHPGFTDLLETPDKQLRRAMDVILFGSLEMTRAVVPHMTGGGSIVNVGTMSTRVPMRGEGGYAVAKAAMGTATQYMALELGEKGIRVNQAILGWLDGPGVRFYLTMTAEAKGITEQDVYDDIASRNPLGRIPPDEACAGAILYLLSRYASEVTGATLDVNGGEYMPA